LTNHSLSSPPAEGSGAAGWLNPSVLFLSSGVGIGVDAITMTLLLSMLADVVEDVAVRTGLRVEGSIMSVPLAASQVAVGAGSYVASGLLALADLPPTSSPADVTAAPADVTAAQAATPAPHSGAAAAASEASEEQRWRFLVLYVPLSVCIYAFCIAMLLCYEIDRSRHEANLQELKCQRRGTPSAATLRLIQRTGSGALLF